VVNAGSIDPDVIDEAVRLTVAGKHTGAGFVIARVGAGYIVTMTWLISLQPSGVTALM
jgi:hypothetical protein